MSTLGTNYSHLPEALESLIAFQHLTLRDAAKNSMADRKNLEAYQNLTRILGRDITRELSFAYEGLPDFRAIQIDLEANRDAVDPEQKASTLKALSSSVTSFIRSVGLVDKPIGSIVSDLKERPTARIVEFLRGFTGRFLPPLPDQPEGCSDSDWIKLIRENCLTNGSSLVIDRRHDGIDAPKEIGLLFTGLEHCIISGVNFEDGQVPPNLFKCTGLRSLEITYSNLTPSSIIDLVHELTNLEFINLNACSNKAATPPLPFDPPKEWLVSHEHLVGLNLRGNQMTQMPKLPQSIEHLGLSATNITAAQVLAELAHVEHPVGIFINSGNSAEADNGAIVAAGHTRSLIGIDGIIEPFCGSKLQAHRTPWRYELHPYPQLFGE